MSLTFTLLGASLFTLFLLGLLISSLSAVTERPMPAQAVQNNMLLGCIACALLALGHWW